jgi:hypothetical protein
LFAAFLGINPVGSLLENTGLLTSLPPANVANLTGSSFFPDLVSVPFHNGLDLVFGVAGVMMLIAAVASWYASTPTAVRSLPRAGERVGEEPEDYKLIEEPEGT